MELGLYNSANDDYQKVKQLLTIRSKNKPYTYIVRPNAVKEYELACYYYSINNIFNLKENYQEAIKSLTAAIAFDKEGHSEYYYSRGIAYWRIFEDELGCKDMSKASEMGDTYAIELYSKYCN